ncbi:MAG: translational GTPase TypA [Fibrobacterales bacterium]
MSTTELRNIAIIAHVDHGKTTLVDGLLKQGGAYRDHEETEERALDSDDIEKERGITILSAQASINFKGTRINIVDTPGHADFGGQVERVLGTVDGVLLIVDAWDGPMAQTRFVTKKALARGLKPIVVINKIDRDGCDPQGALDKVFDLFCDLDANEEQLNFPYMFACGRAGTCRKEMPDSDSDLVPLLDMILAEVEPPHGDLEADPILQISSLQYSDFLGRLAVGRLETGSLKVGQTLNQSHPDGTFKKIRLQKIMRYEGIELTEVPMAQFGDIVSLAGVSEFDIGDTLSHVDRPKAYERIAIDPPTLSMNFSINDSPLCGQFGGKFLTGNHLEARLMRAQMADPALKVEKSPLPGTFIVAGRGVLHLTILIENMRRELYEFSVGAPKVIFHKEEGKTLEPIETFSVEVPSEFSGSIIDELGKRKGEMLDMHHEGDSVHVEYAIPSRALIGVRPILLSLSKGYAISQSIFRGYEPYKGEIQSRKNGVLIAKEAGDTTAYALWKLEDRGVMILPPGTEVYPGMIIGEHNKDTDIIVNCTKGKQQTNIRSSGADDATTVSPYKKMSLEECVTFINPDEVVEITPEALRIRKLYLDENKRKQIAKQGGEIE